MPGYQAVAAQPVQLSSVGKLLKVLQPEIERALPRKVWTLMTG